MNHYIDSLQKLSAAHRSRANMTKLTDMLGNLEETRDALAPWLEKAEELNSALEAFADETERMPEDILPDGAAEQIYDLVSKLTLYAPGRDGALTSFAEFHQTAEQGLEELENSMEDRSCTAEDRDTMWYETADQAGNMAVALEELASLGQDPEDESEDVNVPRET